MPIGNRWGFDACKSEKLHKPIHNVPMNANIYDSVATALRFYGSTVERIAKAKQHRTNFKKFRFDI